MLNTTQNCCRFRWALDHKLLTNSATVTKKISQNSSKSLVCHRFKGVFYPALGFYTLGLWPCQSWSTREAGDVVDLIAKQITSTVLMLSPTVLKLTPTVRKVSPTVLNILHSTDVIPHCTDVILHCTEQHPQYWKYPPQYWSYPHMYWKYPPTVQKVSLHSTEYPSQHWCYPSTCTDVISHCTE